MRTRTPTTLMVLLLVALGASAPRAATLDGSVTLGGTIMNDTGDPSAVQEIANVEDGFTVYDLRLNGTLGPRHAILLDLRDINLDSRRGQFVYRIPGTFRLNAALDQHRQFFFPAGDARSLRKDWRLGAQLTPTPWANLHASGSYVTRSGDRFPYPLGTLGLLGPRYDSALLTGELAADFRQVEAKRGFGFSLRGSEFSDEEDPRFDRTGHVAAARFFFPTPWVARWNHFVRVSHGERRLETGDLDHRLETVRYTSVIEPVDPLQLRYEFEHDRVDDESTDLLTDRFVNALEATWFHRYGQLEGGYAYETNDDDRSLTSYHTWRAGVSLRPVRAVSARFEYADRAKKDVELLTLLREVESARLRARLELRPVADLVLGGSFARRERDFPDLGVSLDGDVVDVFGRYALAGWGSLTADYSHAEDDFLDRVGSFATTSDIVTARADLERIPGLAFRGLRLGGGVTYLDVGGDRDVEKSIVFAEGSLRIARDYRLELAYNAYNYDDYVLLDRYYTANVLRIGVGYDLHVR